MSAALERQPRTGRTPAPRPRVFDVLGVPVSEIDLPAAIATIEDWAKSDIRTYVCVTGAHGILECRNDRTLLSAHKNAGMVTPDGMPLVWTAHALGLKTVGRVYGPDLMRAISERADANRIRHFYYGGAPGVAERLARRLASLSPTLEVVGCYTPPFRPLTPDEDTEVVAMINRLKPDIVWVGLSTPKQERWMQAHLGRIDVPVMIGVGAAFDFLSGTKKQAPRVLQRNGLEWLFRALTEPKRLMARYAKIVPLFVALSAIRLAKRKFVRYID